MNRGGGGSGGSWRPGGIKSSGPSTALDLDNSLIVKYKEIPLFPEYQVPQHPPKEEYEDTFIDSLLSSSSSNPGYTKSVHLTNTLLQDLKSSPFSLVPQEKKENDVERYADRFKMKNIPNEEKLRSVITSFEFFPTELHYVLDPTKRSLSGFKKLSNKKIDLEALEKMAEKKSGTGTSKKNEGEEDDENQMEPVEDDDFDEEDNDYVVDYYDEDYDAAGQDSDAGGGGGDY